MPGHLLPPPQLWRLNVVTDLKPEDLARLREIAEKAKAGLADGAWTRDPRTYWIWAPSLKGGHAHIADIRGWGYLTGGGHGALGMSEEDAIEAQTAWGEHIATFGPDLVLSLLADRARMEKALADARQTIIAFCAPFAVQYAHDHGYDDGELHPGHYKILAAAGARMVDFRPRAEGASDA